MRLVALNKNVEYLKEIKMKFKRIYIFCALVALTGCAANTNVQENTEATSAVSEINAIDQIVGKRLVANNGTVFLLRADGTMGGTIDGEKVVGVYKVNGNESCSTYTSPKSLTDREFCSTPVIKKGSVVFHRRDGSKSQKYKIEE